MSHFTEIETEYKQDSEKELVEALETVFGKGNVEVHEKGAALMGYQGDNRSLYSKSSPDYAPPCEIVIRKEYVGSASNDIGFKRTSDGKFVAYVSDFDKGHHFGKAKQGLVSQEYGMRVAEKTLKSNGWKTIRVNEKDGSTTIKTTGKVSVGVGGGWGNKNW